MSGREIFSAMELIKDIVDISSFSYVFHSAREIQILGNNTKASPDG